MSKCKDKTQQEEALEKEEAAESIEDAAADSEVTPEADEKDEIIKSLQKQLEETKDALLRQIAEFDNFKKRESANREKQSAFVKGETLKALLPCLDNIDRAAQADSESEDYATGVMLTVKGLQDALVKMGLEKIEPLNEQFDVNFHQAVMRVEDDSVGENTVVQVLQCGYKLGDNVLRHAMVKVANCD